MQEITVTIDGQAEEGYTFLSSISKDGETIKDMIQRKVNEIGIAGWHDLKRSKVQDLIAKIQDDPDAYVAAIEPIYADKVAILEAEKAAAEELLKEELPILEIPK